MQRNLLFLEDYLHTDKEDLDEQAVCAVTSWVVEHPGITLQELLAIGKIPSDLVFAMLARGELYVDLRAVPLAEPQRVQVFRNQETARGYAVITSSSSGSNAFVNITLGISIVWDGRSWTIVNLGATHVTLLAADGTLIDLPQTTFESLIKAGRLSNSKESVLLAESHPAICELLAKASPTDFEEANRRYAIIKPWLAGHPTSDQNTPIRTIRDWMGKWRKAEARYGCGYIGLLSHHQAKGNCQPKLPDNVSNMLTTFILEDYETLKQKTKVAVYGALVRKCEEQRIVAPSYKTFVEAIQKRPRTEQIQKRQGKRAAYQHEAFYQELTLTTPRHGDPSL